MKRFVLFVVGLAIYSSSAMAQVPIKPAGATCASLASDYEDLSKDLASIFAAGAGDNSAPREQIRQQKETLVFSKAQLIISLMQGAKCPLPINLPNMAGYLSAALRCETATTEDDIKSRCARASWIREVN